MMDFNLVEEIHLCTMFVLRIFRNYLLQRNIALFLVNKDPSLTQYCVAEYPGNP